MFVASIGVFFIIMENLQTAFYFILFCFLMCGLFLHKYYNKFLVSKKMNNYYLEKINNIISEREGFIAKEVTRATALRRKEMAIVKGQNTKLRNKVQEIKKDISNKDYEILQMHNRFYNDEERFAVKYDNALKTIISLKHKLANLKDGKN